MKTNKFSTIYTILFCTVLVVFIVYSDDHELLPNIITVVSQHRFSACLFMWSLFVLMVFIPFFPEFALFTLSGSIFSSRIFSFAINLFGVFIMATLAYTIGSISKLISLSRTEKRKISNRSKLLQKTHILFRKLFNIRRYLFWQGKNVVENSSVKSIAVLRLNPFIPAKFLGKVCGSAKVNYKIYILGSFLGSLPSMTSATLLGKSLSDPESPAFFISLVLTVLVIISSIIIYKNTNKKGTHKYEKISYR